MPLPFSIGPSGHNMSSSAKVSCAASPIEALCGALSYPGGEAREAAVTGKVYRSR